jgi:hypothetical protein
MEFGLFSVNKGGPETSGESDVAEHWVRGFEVDLESRPNYVRVMDDTDSTTITHFSDANAPRYLEVKPFFIEVEDYATTLGLLGLDRRERVLRQLEAVTQKAVERELYEGDVARGQQNVNTYLVDEDTAVVYGTGGATAVPPHHAIAYLERGIGNNSAYGEQGFLHITRDVAALLGSQYMLTRNDDDPNHIHIETNSGTTVVIGSGYTGNGIAYRITNKALTTNVATITTGKPHYLSVGESVKITGVDATFNGTYTVASIPTTTTFTFAKTAADVTSTAVSATTAYAQMQSSAEHKWIYATGIVGLKLGKSEVVNDNLAQAYDVTGNKNDMRFKAVRPAVAYFDTSIHLAAKVDVSTTAI